MDVTPNTDYVLPEFLIYPQYVAKDKLSENAVIVL